MATTQQILADYAAIDYTPPYALAGQPTATLPAAPDPTLVAAYQPLTNDAVISAIEGETYTLVTVDAVIREYQGAFGTVPDQAGVAFWVHAIDHGTASLATLSVAFANSPQFQAITCERHYAGQQSLVTAIYQNVLQRAPDAAGLAFWLGSGLNAAQLLQVFTQSAEAVNLFAPHIIAFQNLEAAGTPPCRSRRLRCSLWPRALRSLPVSTPLRRASRLAVAPRPRRPVRCSMRCRSRVRLD